MRMKTVRTAALGALVAAMGTAQAAVTVVSLSGGGWQFAREGQPAQAVEVPHDWAIAGPFIPGVLGDTGKLPWRGRGEYARSFEAPANLKDVTAYLEFDGVMARPEVFVNGERAGSWEYGYLGFRLDVTKFVKPGANELRVKVDTTSHFSRWYPGAGIYRDVRVRFCRGEHVVPGTLAITTPSVTDEKATVNVAYTSSVRGPTNLSFVVAKPVRWDVDNPHLYELKLLGETFRYGIRTFEWTADDGFHLNGRRVQLKGVNLHSDLGPLGMAFNRSAARRQLEIMKEMGANALRTSHNPPAPEMLDLCDELGLVVWDECFDKWDVLNVEHLDNARVSTAGRLDSEPLEAYVEKNLAAFVARDRNHPCVFVWSMGNEIAPGSEGVTPERVKRFRDFLNACDPTRPAGMGCCHSGKVGTGAYDNVDVSGWNYNRGYRKLRERCPKMPLVYTESASAVSTFGYYEPVFNRKYNDIYTNDLEVSGYDRNAFGYCDIPDYEFENMACDRFVAGEFVWTGIDYLGEPVPYCRREPQEKMARSAYFGIVDLTLQPKDRYWLYRSHWRPDVTTVHLLPHWTWPDRVGRKVPVSCYTNGDEAELFLNGRSLGRRRKNPNVSREHRNSGDERYYALCEKYRLMWNDVVYEPGELKVVAYKGGKAIGEDVRRTAGRPVALKVTLNALGAPADAAERLPVGDEVVYLRVSVVDEKGVECPEETRRVSFAVEAPGRILSVGNGDPRGYESFKDVSGHPLFHGVATAIVQLRPDAKPRAFAFTASAPGLKSARYVVGGTGEVRGDGLRAAAPFADNMVLQRDRKVAVWGWSRPGDTVRVRFAGQEKTAKVDEKGDWRVDLDPLAASKTPRDLVITSQPLNLSTSQLVFTNVVVGEVWLASGQSNMELPLWSEMPRYRDGHGVMVAQMTHLPNVRFGHVPISWKHSNEPRELPRIPCRWMMAEPENLRPGRRWSALAFWYARELSLALDVPVGVLAAYAGGTTIEQWTPQSAADAAADLAADYGAKAGTYGCTGGLYNEYLATLAPYTARGFLWYQGCNNRADNYCRKMHVFYEAMARAFENPKLPFYFVQVPYGNFNRALEQAKFAAEEPNAEMAVICDVHNFHDVHPQEKEVVARRLALHALSRDYGFKGIVHRSPAPVSATADGDRVTVKFSDAQSFYLYNANWSMTNYLELAGADGKFRPAEIVNMACVTNRAGELRATHTGAQTKGPELVLRAEGVKAPQRVRHLHSMQVGNLFNEVNLPVQPFDVMVK